MFELHPVTCVLHVRLRLLQPVLHLHLMTPSFLSSCGAGGKSVWTGASTPVLAAGVRPQLLSTAAPASAHKGRGTLLLLT